MNASKEHLVERNHVVLGAMFFDEFGQMTGQSREVGMADDWEPRKRRKKRKGMISGRVDFPVRFNAGE